jgi:hypothetical protein
VSAPVAALRRLLGGTAAAPRPRRGP